jgi:hypothetical protein
MEKILYSLLYPKKLMTKAMKYGIDKEDMAR